MFWVININSIDESDKSRSGRKWPQLSDVIIGFSSIDTHYQGTPRLPTAGIMDKHKALGAKTGM